MSIEPGQSLLHFRLAEKIGEGGMGVVWKAVDTTLDREVAIKVLPDVLSAEPERLARFDREAKLLASLEHPNIASVYGLHETTAEGGAPSVRFLCMEYVRGEDLSQRLARGPIAVDEALAVARQIAEALEGAHSSGVVHRDLKPANIMLTPDGKAKVLDFGLAKAFETDLSSGAGSPSMSPTLTSAGTVAGVILGTAAYMSPEQARGYAADKRSDIWAFGCVLFEMLTRGQIFRGDTISDTLAAVLKVEPDWERLPNGLPRGIRRLLRRCLHKDASRRLHAAADARIEIDEALESPEEELPATAAAVAQRRTPRWIVAILTLAGIAAAGVAGWWLKPRPAEPPTRRFVITAADPTEVPGSPVISPDGRRIAYIDENKLKIRDLDQVEPRTVEDSDKAASPFWSPDSTHVAYLAGEKLWKVAAAGGQPARICEVDSAREGVWADDDTITLNKGRALLRVSARGGEVETIAEADRAEVSDFHGVDLLPEGRMAVVVHYQDNTQGIEVWTGDERKSLLRIKDTLLWELRWVDSGFIIYTRQQSNEGVWALPFSAASGEASGEPFLVTADGAAASVSRDGTMIHLGNRGADEVQLTWITVDGEVGPAIGQTQEGMFMPSLSPDGTRVLVAGQENSDWDIWIHDVARGTKTRLTFMDGLEGAPKWSLDGKQVYFHHPAFGRDSKIYSIPADGRGDPKELTAGAYFELSPSGEHLIFSRDSDETENDLWTMPADGSAEATIFLQTAADENRPRFSPDGRFVAYHSDESGRDEVYVKPFPTGEGKWQVSINGGRAPVWSRDGERLYYKSDGAAHRVRVTNDPGLTLSTPERVLDGGELGLRFFGGFEVAPTSDPERFIVVQPVEDEEDEPEIRGIFVVENWLAEFQD